MQYIDIVIRVLVVYREMPWVEGKLPKLQSGIEEFNPGLRRVFAPHCVSGSYTFKFHRLDHPVENLKRFGDMSCTDEAPFERLNKLIERSYRMTSRRLSTRMQETVLNMKNALFRVQRSEDGVDMSRSGAAVSKKQQRLESEGEYLV